MTHRGARKNPFPIHQMDWVLAVMAVTLTAIGLVMIYNASYYNAGTKATFNYDPAFFVKGQLAGVVTGAVAMVLLSRIDYHFWQKQWVVYTGILASIVLLAACWIPGIGVNLYGARRWLNLGVSVQPSEIAKLALVVFLAWYMTRNHARMKKFGVAFFPPGLLLGLFAGIILLQPNMSTAVVLALTTFAMLFIGGCHLGHWLGLLGAGFAAGGGLIAMASYRMARLLAFLDPWNPEYLRKDSYQLVQSLYALGAGNLFGVGFGMSRQKYAYLPFAESDFIFSIIGEEFGWFGCVILLSLFGILIWRGLRIGLTARDRFGSLLAVGITALIAFQVLMNVAVVTGSIPPTGLPLPFISAGGTNLTILLGEIGILLNISRTIRMAE
ncbi:MAG: putative lipid II flippase FtsW [Clostridia bacterium]|nr:putative lipid II flippase FtsW [Clostridia bacterium]